MGGWWQREGHVTHQLMEAAHLRWYVPAGKVPPRATEDRLALLCTCSSAQSHCVASKYISIPHLLRAGSTRQAWIRFRKAFVLILSSWSQHWTWSLMLISGLGSDSGTQVIELRSQLPRLR